MRSTVPVIFSLTLSATLFGCAAAGGDDAQVDRPTPLAPAADTEIPAPTEGAADVTSAKGGGPTSSVYPAPHPSMPQIPMNGGVVLHDPVVVSVTFAGDAWESKLQAFGEQVGGLSWWSTVHDGYGVGRATSGGHVTIPDAPAATITDVEVERFVTSRIADGTLPAPTDQTIYTIYYPRSTTVTLSGEGGAASCQVFLGYHSTVTVPTRGASGEAGATVPIAYAVVNRCSDRLDDVTMTASHELTEAATDPHPIDAASCGFVTLQDNAWTGLGGENADMCAGVSGVNEAGWALTRVWNNVTAAAGNQPCVPAPDTGGTPYYNAGIVHDVLTIPPGGAVQTEVDCYAFGPLPAPMSLEALVTSNSPLRIGFDQKTCTNGDKVVMTVGVKAGAPRGYAHYFTLMSRISSESAHLWRGRVIVQ
jgi:hypothetical protein